MFANPFINMSDFFKKIEGNTDFFALQDFHINISSAITIQQHCLLTLLYKSSENKLMQSVASIVMKEFSVANIKFISNIQIVQHYYSKLMMYYYGGGFVEDTNGAKIEKLFKSDEWNTNQCYKSIKNAYKAHYSALLDTISYGKSMRDQTVYGLSKDLAITDREWHLLDFFYKQILNMVSPRNHIFTNPEIMNQVISTQGKCLKNGAENFLNDIRKMEDGIFTIATVDKTPFVLGQNIASTAGKVVYQNDLFQLIMYDSCTEEVHSVPILITTAWINKYYILDLGKENSFVKWLVDKGYTVFVISWINPDSAHSDKTFEDYVCDGFIKALEEVKKITKQPKVNCISYCLGGTLTTIAAAYLAEIGDDSINSMTLFTTLIDFEDAGDVKIFVTDEIISEMDKSMKEKGYLDGRAMFSMFLWLRSNDMVWHYYINNYMFGNAPKSFDVLFWNADSTRMPYKMHSYYLRNMYLENNLVKTGYIKIKEIGIDLSKIKTEIYCLSNQEDHIAPWASVYKGMGSLAKANIKFVLAKAGHVIGIVNPPSLNKYSYYTNSDDIKKIGHKEWLQKASENAGSWWEDWDNWIKSNNLYGTKVSPIKLDKKRIIEDAPGSYVKM